MNRALCAIFVSFLAIWVQAAQPKTGFLEYCKLPGQGDAKATVHRLLKEVGETDCIKAFAKLKEKKLLVLRFSKLVDLRPLSDLIKLEDLSLGGNKIKDLRPLKTLKNLKKLSLGGVLGFNEVEDLSPLMGLKLTHLVANNNMLKSIAPLATMTTLEHLNLGHNEISSIAPLKGLVNLNFLHIWGNRIKDVLPLQHLKKLVDLNLNHNLIEGISFVQELKELEYLWLRGNPIQSMKGMSCGKLKMLLLQEGMKNPCSVKPSPSASPSA